MSLLVFMHHRSEGPCELGRALSAQGHPLRLVRLYDGEPLPADLDDVDGIVSMGGPMNVEDAGRLPWLAGEMALLGRAHERGVPIVGVCLGCQLLAHALGGQVAAMPRPPGPELGFQSVRLAFAGTIDPLLAGIPWESMQFHMHGQEVVKPPPGAAVLAASQACKVQAFRAGLKSYGFQYHFEWTRRDLEAAAAAPMVAQAGSSAAQVLAGVPQHYEGYRRLGDRLADNLAALLFPIDKR